MLSSLTGHLTNSTCMSFTLLQMFFLIFQSLGINLSSIDGQLRVRNRLTHSLTVASYNNIHTEYLLA